MVGGGDILVSRVEGWMDRYISLALDALHVEKYFHRLIMICLFFYYSTITIKSLHKYVKLVKNVHQKTVEKD